MKTALCGLIPSQTSTNYYTPDFQEEKSRAIKLSKSISGKNNSRQNFIVSLSTKKWVDLKKSGDTLVSHFLCSQTQMLRLPPEMVKKKTKFFMPTFACVWHPTTFFNKLLRISRGLEVAFRAQSAMNLRANIVTDGLHRAVAKGHIEGR